MENLDCRFGSGERDGTRTHDHLIKSQVLYQLSYALVINAHAALGEGVGAAALPVKHICPPVVLFVRLLNSRPAPDVC